MQRKKPQIHQVPIFLLSSSFFLTLPSFTQIRQSLLLSNMHFAAASDKPLRVTITTGVRYQVDTPLPVILIAITIWVYEFSAS
mmetsp:Transcript_29216/g.58782  ORF Transcript_29216/g.58782 Transcript_29216/m.58782 type:complete len:83 (+) Transcript_29216:562-810(+)